MAAHKNNQYAAKGKGYDGLLNIQTVKAEKAAYKAQAESKGLTLTDWVNQVLREQLKRDKGLLL
jgi:predicted HicB family RNase H-like nuclease